MKGQVYGRSADRKKAVAIGALFLTAAAIVLLGISFCVYSLINHVGYQVLQSQIPGAVFGAVVAFLGVRYFLAVRKLKDEVYKTTSRFSWSNFKKRGNGSGKGF